MLVISRNAACNCFPYIVCCVELHDTELLWATKLNFLVHTFFFFFSRIKVVSRKSESELCKNLWICGKLTSLKYSTKNKTFHPRNGLPRLTSSVLSLWGMTWPSMWSFCFRNLVWRAFSSLGWGVSCRTKWLCTCNRDRGQGQAKVMQEACSKSRSRSYGQRKLYSQTASLNTRKKLKKKKF